MQFYHKHLEKQLDRAQFRKVAAANQHHSNREKSQTRNDTKSIFNPDNL
jgi:hypothetical protein